MADENEEQDTGTEEGGPADDEGTTEASAEPAPPVSTEERFAVESPAIASERLEPVTEHNRRVLGQLIVHYAARDVTLVLDGDAALRLMTMFARRREGRLADLLRPDMSSAHAGWVVLDLHEPLAMSWVPGLPAPRQRTAVDPVLPQAA